MHQKPAPTVARRRYPAELKTHASSDRPTVQCSREWHIELARHEDTFRAETRPVGPLHAAGLVIELGNCRACGSTLAGGWDLDHQAVAR